MASSMIAPGMGARFPQALLEPPRFACGVSRLRLFLQESATPFPPGELSPELIPTKELQEFMGSISITSREFGYSDPMGDRELREVLTRYLHSQGISATPENILV